MSSSAPLAPVIDEELRTGILINIFISGILGFTLNSLLAWVLIKKLRKGGAHGDIKLCSFIAVSDMIVSCLLILRAIVAKYPSNLLKEDPNWCKFDAAVTTVFLVVCGYSLGVMGLERFFLVCFNIEISVLFWFGMIAVIWVTQLVPVWVAMSENVQFLTKNETSCTTAPLKTGYVAYILAFVYFFVSFFSVLVSYISIMIVKFRQCLNQINLNIPKEQVYSELRSTFTKSIINIALYILVFSGKLYTIAYEFGTGRKRTLIMDIISNGLVVYSGFVNALILLYMNGDVRKDFISLLKYFKSKIFK